MIDDLLSARFRQAEFSGTYYTTTAHALTATAEIPKLFARYLLGCGHDVEPASVRTTESRLTVDYTWVAPRTLPPLLTAEEARFVQNSEMPGPWGTKALMVTATASLNARLLPYPRCGDWACTDDADWTEADPVDEPAVYAGVAAERRLASGFLGLEAAFIPRELRDEVLASIRRQAHGEPLWTIDVRPPAPRRWGAENEVQASA